MDVAGGVFIVAVGHGVCACAAGEGFEFGCEGLEFGQGGDGFYDALVCAGELGVLDTPSFCGEMACDVTHFGSGDIDLYVDEGLQEFGSGFGDGFDEGFATSGGECDFFGIDIVVFAIVENAADAGHGVAGDAAIGDDLPYTLFNCGPILTGNCAADYFGDEFE